jgi:hypothetical protein
MWLAGRLVPDHKTIADFRKDNGPAIRKVWEHGEGFQACAASQNASAELSGAQNAQARRSRG